MTISASTPSQKTISTASPARASVDSISDLTTSWLAMLSWKRMRCSFSCFSARISSANSACSSSCLSSRAPTASAAASASAAAMNSRWRAARSRVALRRWSRSGCLIGISPRSRKTTIRPLSDTLIQCCTRSSTAARNSSSSAHEYAMVIMTLKPSTNTAGKRSSPPGSCGVSAPWLSSNAFKFLIPINGLRRVTGRG
ncbi:PP99 [Orf virus]|uniref:PP99 n=1 Tax=Orf virus TaxID=10258 RepID=F1AX14_ORFV|nr:PP99 [Orf virus]